MKIEIFDDENTAWPDVICKLGDMINYHEHRGSYYKTVRAFVLSAYPGTNFYKCWNGRYCTVVQKRDIKEVISRLN